MAEYCDKPDLEGLLPADHGFTDAALLAFRVRGAEACDAWLRRRYRVPLPDTPATPGGVRQAATQYSAVFALMQLGMANRLVDGDFVFNLRKMADADMERYANGKQDLGTTIVTGEVMTFGIDPLGDDEYELAASHWLIDRDTVEIAGFEYGYDFFVEYQGRHRGWILTRANSLIVDGMTVSYEYDFFPNSSEIKEDIDSSEMRLYR